MASQVRTHYLTIDVEDYYMSPETIPVETWDNYPDRISDSLGKTLDLLSENGARATFFLLAHCVERAGTEVRRISEEGHEAAVHGVDHTYVSQMTPDRFREQLKRAKGIIEDATGRKVIGYRAPAFSITDKTPWAWEILLEEGFRYDSSIFPVNTYLYGHPGAQRTPYTARGNGPDRLIEFPVSTRRFMGMNVPAGGGFFLRLYPYSWLRNNIRALEKEGLPAVIYFHPWELDKDHPDLPLRGKVRWIHYRGLKMAEKKFTRMLKDFRFAPLAEWHSKIIEGTNEA
jgi:polysaccharide deacetylase family protein (PEP-CTERM system associated)